MLNATILTKRDKLIIWVSVIVLVASLAVISVFANPSSAEAASWHKSGSSLTNGKATIYYSTTKTSDGSNKIYTINKRDAPGAKGKKLFSTKVSFMSTISLEGYSNGNVFYSVGMSYGIPRTLKVYKTSTKKTKTFPKVGADYQMSGKYLIGMSDCSNVLGKRKLYSINMSTCKQKTVASVAYDYTIRKGKLYFLKGTKFKRSNQTYSIAVYRSKLSGASQKKVSKAVYGEYGYIYAKSASVRAPSKFVSIKY